MQADSHIDPAVITAYIDTEYQVLAAPPFCLRIGLASTELLAAHAAYGIKCSAFITACNPRSQRYDDVDNSARQNSLAKTLTQRKLAYTAGIGQHPSNGWPGEASYLVFGLTLDEARAMAMDLEQNAFVWSGADGVPRLILMR